MASSLLTKSVFMFRPKVAIVVSTYRLLTIHYNKYHNHNSENKTQSRPFSSSSMPKFTFDRSFLRSQLEIMPEIPSMLFTMVKGEEMSVNVPGLEKTESDEGQCVCLHMPGVQEDVSARVEGDFLLIEGKTDDEIYLAGMKLSENFDKNSGLNGEIRDGMLKLTLTMVKDNELKTNFVDANVKIPRPTVYCVMFDQSYLGKDLCEIIAHPAVKSKSFTMYKTETDESIYIKGNMPGVEKVEVTREGLCVSLNMPGFEIEDVESGFEYGTLIIEGKRGIEYSIEHYIAGVRVLEGFQTENHLIKREMQDGIYKATLPRVDVIEEEAEKRINRLEFVAYH